MVHNRADAVILYTVGGDATSGDDYTPLSGTLTIPEDSQTGDIVISALADSVLDNGETVVVTLGTPTTTVGVVRLGSPSVATANIVDSGTVTVSVDVETVEEGESIEFMVTLSGSVAEPVTVGYRTEDGTAMARDDYYAVANGSLEIRAGETTGTFTVRTVDDNEGETTETFTVHLSLGPRTPAGVDLEREEITATIADNDITLEPLDNVTVAEGAQAPIALRLDRMTTEQVTLSYEVIAGSATFGDDFLILAPDGSQLPPIGTVPLPPGIQEGAVAVHAVDDTLAENQETFTVRVMLGSGGSPREATVTITDNDTLRVSVTGPKTVAEGSAATYTVKLGGDVRGTADVAVAYTVGGTAKTPADYAAPSERVVIPAGDETARFTIQTKTDKVLEPDETPGGDAHRGEHHGRFGSSRKSEIGDDRDPGSGVPLHQPGQPDAAARHHTGLGGGRTGGGERAHGAGGAGRSAGGNGRPDRVNGGSTGRCRRTRRRCRTARTTWRGCWEAPPSWCRSAAMTGRPAAVLASRSGAAATSGRSVAATRTRTTWTGTAPYGAPVSAPTCASWTACSPGSRSPGPAAGWTTWTSSRPTDREGTYASWLISAYPYVGWTTPDFGLWATGGFGFGGVTIDDADEDMEPQEADLTQWSLGAGASVTVLSTDEFIAGGTTALKLKAEGFLAGASVAENEAKTIQELAVGVNQARAAIEASHAQHFAGGGSLKPSLEIGGRLDGGDGETGAGLEVGGGVTYADPGSGLTVAAGGRALVIRDGNYGEWGLTGLIQLDPTASGHGLMMSVRPTWGVTVSGVSGLWEHGTFDLLAGGNQPGGRVEAEIGYGLPAFGTAGVLTPYAGASLTGAGAYSLSVGGRLELGPAFDLTLEAERSDSADPNAAPEHDVTLEGSFRW